MPKVAMDYSKTHFYKIVCKDPTVKEIYVGHTTNFVKRKYYHKNICHNPNNREHNTYKYRFIRDNGGWDNWEMVLIEREQCEDSIDAVKRERYYIEELQSSLNKSRPIISKDEETLYDKDYYQRNKEKFREKGKERHENKKEECSEYAKAYYKNNQPKLKQRSHERYESKKEEINQARGVKMTCECGATFCMNNKWRHKKSTKHTNYMNSIEI